MAKGLDYTTQTTAAWAREIKRLGYDFVCRYLVPEKYAWKRLTATESEILSHAGLNIVSVFESYANRAGEGAAAGTADGMSALAETKKVGQPVGSAIYFAVDYDAPTLHYDAIEAYLRAAQAQIPGYHVGVYGSFYVVQEMCVRGAAKYLWQTYAWSKGKKFGKTNVHQYLNGQGVAGVTVDFNDSFGGEGWWNTLEPVKPVKIEEAGPFKDVPSDHWAYGLIKQAKEQGIISGYPDGTFKPDQPITRAEAVALVMAERSKYDHSS